MKFFILGINTTIIDDGISYIIIADRKYWRWL